MAQVGVRDATGRFIETFEIFAKLPGPGSLTSINVRHATTVAELKSLIELVCGIPCDLQLLSYRHHSVLTDGDTLGRLCVLPGARLPVKVTYGFDGLVDAALRGDLKEVLRKVAMTMEMGGMSQRRFVAMFIAAHKGFHYLVDRMLCDGAHPNTQTPSGRTALHVACAMGNSGCIDSLLQHGALLDIKDTSHQTPADTAASCGQQGAQRRVVLYSRILANKATKEKTCSWSTSPRFPKSKLGSSVAPTISLKDLAITPGPELMITAWRGGEHRHHYFERTQRPLSAISARSSLFQNDSATSSTESWDSLRNVTGHKSSQHQAPSKTQESSPYKSKITTGRQSVAHSAQLHDRPSSAHPSTAGRRPKSSSSKSVKFAQDEPQRPPTNMDKYSSNNTFRHSVQVPSDSYRLSAQMPASGHHPSLELGEQNDAAKGCLRKVTHTNGNDRNISRHDLRTSETSNVNRQIDHGGGNNRSLGNVKADDLSSNSSDQSSEQLDFDETNGMRINYLNDRLRHEIDLPVEHPQRLDFMKEEADKSSRAPSPHKVPRRKPTPEENEQAFNDWLASKSQDARDRKLVNKVQIMLNDAFGKKDETLVTDDDDGVQTKTPLSFEAWAEKKSIQDRLRTDRLVTESAKRDQEVELKAAVRLDGGKSVETWLAQKVEKQRQERQAAKEHENEKQRAKAKRESAAQDVFKKWCMQKQWEELQMLKEKPRGGAKRRPKSGTKRKIQNAHHLTSTRRARSHSAPPRRPRVGITPS